MKILQSAKDSLSKLSEKAVPGFTSGHGKSIEISDDLVQKVKNAGSENKVSPKPSTSGLGGFSTGLGNSVSISHEALSRSKGLFEPETPPPVSSDSGFSGFSTGNGKQVSVSKDILRKSKELFTQENVPKMYSGFCTQGKLYFWYYFIKNQILKSIWFTLRSSNFKKKKSSKVPTINYFFF